MVSGKVEPTAVSKQQKNIVAENKSNDNMSSVDAELEQKSSQGVLSAFVAHPPGIFFADKEPTEDLILLLRAHLITTVPWIIVTLLLLVVPVVLLPIVTALGLVGTFGPGFILVATIFWYAIIFTYAFINFLYWYFNVYIVTSERVIDVDWYSVIIRKVSSTQIAKIQDASAVQVGVFAGIFDYGDVVIQTAGTEENFQFTAVPHPQLVAKKIEELMQLEEIDLEGGGGGGSV